MEVTGLNEVARSFSNANNNFREQAEITINRIGNKLLRKCKLKSPVDSGLLRRSWRFKKESDLEALVFNNCHYVGFVNYGHRTKGGGFIDGMYMLEKSIEEIQRELDHELEIMVDNLFR